jgi:formyltetrahydrofolate-dependent phosphoribosylglycinamide formyltransferase
MRIAVLASGSGTNLQALLDSLRSPDGAWVVLVVSDNSAAGALDRARAAGVPTHVLTDPHDHAALLDVLREAEIDLVVLAGYLKLVPAEVVRAFRGMMINLHPALLPSFGGKGMYGARVHRAVLDSGATVTGVTVHIVSEEYDKGPIVAQWPVPVLAGDTPESLAARIHPVEHQLLPAVVRAAARAGRVLSVPCGKPAFAPAAGPPETAELLNAMESG